MLLSKKVLLKRALLCFAFIGGSFLAAGPAISYDNSVDIIPDETVDGDVVLHPAYIDGTVDINGQNISRIDIRALHPDFQARVYKNSEGPYNMTVNAPEGDTLGYEVSTTVWMDNYNTRMILQKQQTQVSAGQTSQVDFIVDSGYIAASFNTNGCTLIKSELWAMKNEAGDYSNVMTRHGGETSYSFPVQPNSDVLVYGSVQVSTGATYSLESKVTDIPAGMITDLSWDIPCTATQLSSIDHNIDYHMEVDSHVSYLYNQGSSSPYRTARHEGTHLFDNLAQSTWRLLTYTYWNNNQNMIGKSFCNIKTLAGEITAVTFDQYPGFLNGTLTLTGTHSIEDTSYAHVYAYGKNSAYPSYQVFSRALASKEDGSFKLALPYGEYANYVTAISFYNPLSGSDYLNSHLYMYDYEKVNDIITIGAGEIQEGHDIEYETGSAIIKFSMADGGTFSAPYIVARSYKYDENSRLSSYVYLSSRTVGDVDRVTMIGFPGTYEVEAWAYVNGSVTTFGKVNIEIVPGVEKVIDIGGPTLNVNNPTAGDVFETDTITVSGTATDESGVVSVTVNGEQVPFISSNNPDDPNEVYFETEITLIEGENTITTVATDEADNSSSDNRAVTFTPPLQQTISVLLDIKPGSCKNPFNVKAKGVLPVVLLGSADFDVTGIDPQSITLQSVDPVRYVIDDAASYVTDGSCNTDMADGYPDLVLKFKIQDIVNAIGDVQDGDVVDLYFSGLTNEEDLVEATDIITIIKKGKKN